MSEQEITPELKQADEPRPEQCGTQEPTIIASISDGTLIKFVNSNSGLVATRVVTGGTVSLFKGFVYNIPITDKHLDLKDYHIVKDNPKLAPKLLIRGVSDGFVTVYSLVMGTLISDGDFLGELQ